MHLCLRHATNHKGNIESRTASYKAFVSVVKKKLFCLHGVINRIIYRFKFSLERSQSEVRISNLKRYLMRGVDGVHTKWQALN